MPYKSKAAKQKHEREYRKAHPEYGRRGALRYYHTHREERRAILSSHSRRKHLKRKFGLTEAQYDELLATQQGVCAICGKTPEANSRRLAIDHDHTNGSIRGILCQWCNAGLGSFQDSVELLGKAIIYLGRADQLALTLGAFRKD